MVRIWDKCMGQRHGTVEWDKGMGLWDKGMVNGYGTRVWLTVGTMACDKCIEKGHRVGTCGKGMG